MRRCTTHALYRSKLRQQDHCHHPQNANPDGSKLESTAQRIGRLFGGGGAETQGGGHHAASHLRSRLESQHQCVPGCAEECGDPLVHQVAGGRPWVWQQDLAPAHKSKENQAWLQKECYDFLPFSHCPLSSPDLNPLDYFVWSYVENITNMTSHNTKASLIAAIRRVFAELPPVLVVKSCFQFRIRIEAVIEAEGGYIE